MRYSKQREVIKRILCETKSHPTAEWIYRQAREVMPSISMGTVYRNLKLLGDTGEAQIIDTDGGVARYDGDVSLHTHFVCLSCGRVIDAEAPLVDCSAMESKGFRVISQKNILFGVCEKCGKSGKD
ncbi:MAG: transcriptional repressor [Clostridiaceae bacterium]|jgi:Fe2+ or Zn2+ uptake regulation protein|nr:transcriptional repressor [Clostridiaceae bacterium]